MITYNGNEFVLQNDMGNAKVERAKLSPGFIPMGMKEHGGIVYIASYNPDTLECEIGSFPSPERDITGSTDIENQTGLVDGLFNNSEYIKSTQKIADEFVPEEQITKLQKLNEEEVLKLNPGDKFITTYEVEPGTGTGVPITPANFNDYFSFSEADKKTFQVNFYKIDSANNIVKLDDAEVKSIAHSSTIDEDEFVYYTQTSSGSIGVEVALNDITYFNAAIRELSRANDTDKRIRIESVGDSDSDVEFKGMRVDIRSVSETNQVTTSSFHVENQGTSDKVSVTVKDFSQNDEVTCQITPYSQYGYTPTLSQILSLKIGQNLAGGNVTDIFKWRVDETNRRLELDFDFKLETENPIKMYIEFYDVWSNVSTIRSITSPSVYGTMRMVLPLVTQPRNNIFDPYPLNPTSQDETKQLGGISFDKLMVNTNTITKALLCNTTTYGADLIRTDNSLRMNHFYIVRISGYEEYEENGTIERKFYDVYKALYTNTIFNDLYDAQRSLSYNDPAFKGDFTKEPYPLNKIGYRATMVSDTSPLVQQEGPVTPAPDQFWTNVQGRMYPFSLDKKFTTPSGYYRSNKKFTITKNYTIGLTKPDNLIFGTLKTNTLIIQNTAGNYNIPAENITDSDLGTADLKMGTKGKLVIPNMNTGATNYPIIMNIETNRGIEGVYVHAEFQGTIKKVRLSDLLYAPNHTGTGNFGCDNKTTKATVTLFRKGWNGANPCTATNNNISMYIKDFVTGEELEIKNNQNGGDTSVVTSIPLLNSVSRTAFQFFSSYNSADLVSIPNNSSLVQKDSRVLFVQRGPAGIANILEIPFFNLNNVNIHEELEDFLYWIYFERLDSSGVQNEGYYINSGTVLGYSESNLTTIDGVTLDVTSIWQSPVTKTYVFESILKALGNGMMDFNTVNINSIISASITKGQAFTEVIDGVLSDSNFIPFIDSSTDIEDIVTGLNLTRVPIVLRLSSDRPTLEAFRDSNVKYNEAKANATRPPDTTLKTDKATVGDGLRNFMRYFTFDAVNTNQLVLSGQANHIPQYFLNRRSDATRKIRSVDILDTTISTT